MHDQGFLFDDSPANRALQRVAPAPLGPEEGVLAERLPGRLRMGTSSHAFAGWRGIVYARTAPGAALARDGLAAYASHPLLRTVALDRAFYAAIPIPEARRLAAQTPRDFRFVVKAHQSITRPDRAVDGSTYGDTALLRREGDANPRFLDAVAAAETVVWPLLEGFTDRLGPILFQFPPLDLATSGRLGGGEVFLDRLATFLAGLPVGPRYAVEFRNRGLSEPPLAARCAALCRAHDVVVSLAVHPSLPPLELQARAAEVFGASDDRRPLLIRWLLGHGLGYDEARDRYAPFDRIVEPDDLNRHAIASLVLESLRRERDAWVIVNNKAEGSAPLTIRGLAERLAAAPDSPPRDS